MVRWLEEARWRHLRHEWQRADHFHRSQHGRADVDDLLARPNGFLERKIHRANDDDCWSLRGISEDCESVCSRWRSRCFCTSRFCHERRTNFDAITCVSLAIPSVLEAQRSSGQNKVANLHSLAARPVLQRSWLPKRLGNEKRQPEICWELCGAKCRDSLSLRLAN